LCVQNLVITLLIFNDSRDLGVAIDLVLHLCG